MNPAGLYRRLPKLLISGLFFLAILHPILFAQAASHDLKNGVYTAEQAQQGKAIYQSHCAMCHANSLDGQGPNSPLKGAAFLNKWSDQTVSDLFTKTIVMMPAMAPGTMTPKETADVLAYILSANKFPAGKSELPSDPQSLETIHIVKP